MKFTADEKNLDELDLKDEELIKEELNELIGELKKLKSECKEASGIIGQRQDERLS